MENRTGEEVGSFKNPLPRPLRSDPLRFYILINGRRLIGSLYTAKGGDGLSSQFFFFLFTFIIILVLIATFISFESQDICFPGEVHGTDKKNEYILFPCESIFPPPSLPTPFNYSLPSFFIIHLSSHLSVHVTLLFLNHSQGRGGRVV